MDFYLPNEVLQVESHLKWIGEVIPFLERALVDRSWTMEEHIRSLSRDTDPEDNSNEGDLTPVTDDNFEVEYNLDNPKFCNVYASRLNEAAQKAYIGEFDEALEKLNLLRKIYHLLVVDQRPAFEYAVDSLTWAIKTLRNSRVSENEESNNNNEVLQDPAHFLRRWNILQENNKCKAVLRYLWGCLGGTLKISEECLLPIYKELVSMDPDYHVWYSIVFRTMRGIRRNLMRHQSGQLNVPSDEELEMCREAYERAPQIYLSIKDMAVVLKESLWKGDQEVWDREEHTYMLCKQLFERALEIATERSQQKWKCKIQVYLAEFLLFGRGCLLDQAEGKRLLDECLQENPDSTTVLHKAGKLCQYGAAPKNANRDRAYRNPDLAARLYEKALHIKPANYPCVKDYLKLLKMMQEYRTYVEVCDSTIPHMKRDYQVSDLSIMKGCVLWIYNPFRSVNSHREAACEAWLYVFMKLPDCTDPMFASIKSPPFSLGRNKQAYINMRQLFETLEDMRYKCCQDDNEKRDAISNFIRALKTSVQVTF